MVNKFTQFLTEFFRIFFGGILGLFYSSPSVNNRGGVIGAIHQMFDIPQYIDLYKNYKSELSAGQLIGAILCFILVIAVFILLIWLAIFFGKRFF